MLNKFSSTLQNLVLFLTLIGSFFGATYFWVRDKLRDFKHKRRIKAIKKDVEIANEPNKPRTALLDWLRNGK